MCLPTSNYTRPPPPPLTCASSPPCTPLKTCRVPCVCYLPEGAGVTRTADILPRPRLSHLHLPLNPSRAPAPAHLSACLSSSMCHPPCPTLYQRERVCEKTETCATLAHVLAGSSVFLRCVDIPKSAILKSPDAFKRMLPGFTSLWMSFRSLCRYAKALITASAARPAASSGIGPVHTQMSPEARAPTRGHTSKQRISESVWEMARSRGDVSPRECASASTCGI